MKCRGIVHQRSQNTESWRSCWLYSKFRLAVNHHTEADLREGCVPVGWKFGLIWVEASLPSIKVKSFVVAPKGGIVVKRLLWWQQNGEYLKHSFNGKRFLKVLIHKRTSPIKIWADAPNYTWLVRLHKLIIFKEVYYFKSSLALLLAPCKGMRIPKSGKFSLLNPESWALESRIPLTFWIQNPRPTDNEWNPLNWNPESTAENPESKRVLVFCIFLLKWV